MKMTIRDPNRSTSNSSVAPFTTEPQDPQIRFFSLRAKVLLRRLLTVLRAHWQECLTTTL
ncbi:MAG: hypothetical protein ABIZ09_10895 [Rhodoferax sp.]